MRRRGSQLIRVSLAGLPLSADKEKLLAIPTGLTIDRQDVDAPVVAGHDSIIGSEPLRAFLENYPPAAARAVWGKIAATR